MHIKHTDNVLHISFEDEPFERSNVLCGQFNKRQVGAKPFKQLERDVTILPFKDKQFDVVYCSHLLQFVDHPVEIFEEIRRISKAAYIKEYSEFAEILFGWPNHQWVISIEGDNVVISRKNPGRYHKFGPLFHTLYQDDQNVHEAFKKHDSILKIAFDWYETDDIIVNDTSLDIESIQIDSDSELDDNNELENDTLESEGNLELELDDDLDDSDSEIQDRISDFNSDKIDDYFEKKEKTTPLFKSSQSDHFNFERFELGKIQQLIDIQ